MLTPGGEICMIIMMEARMNRMIKATRIPMGISPVGCPKEADDNITTVDLASTQVLV